MSKQAKAGYGHPPEHAQFKPGQSGNPKGRPKGTRNLASLVRAATAERVTIVENGKRKSVTKLEAAMKQAVNQAAGGDQRAMRMLMDLLRGFEIAEAPRTNESPKTAAELKAADNLAISAAASLLTSLVVEEGRDE